MYVMLCHVMLCIVCYVLLCDVLLCDVCMLCDVLSMYVHNITASTERNKQNRRRDCVYIIEKGGNRFCLLNMLCMLCSVKFCVFRYVML